MAPLQLRRMASWRGWLILLALAYSLWRLDVSPPLGWDEGWTLTVARTWVERGHYGRLLAGQPASPAFSARPPLVASIALGFRLLGVGVRQGRLVVVLYTLGALLLLYDLARRLYSRRVATGALAVALLMTLLPDVHPMIIGRRVMAEMPMLLFLLAGYVCFLLAFQRSAWFLPLAWLCWGIGLYTKLQPLPFWIASLAIPLIIMLFRRQWRTASWFAIALIGTMGARQLLMWLWQLLVARGTAGGGPLPGLIGATAFVPLAQVRLEALKAALTRGLPTVLGLCHAGWQGAKKHLRHSEHSDADVVRLSVLVLAGSWFAWYVLLSVAWVRYLVPPVFLGSMFVAAWLSDVTGGYPLSFTIKRAARALRPRGFNRQGAGALLATVAVTTVVAFTLYWLALFCVIDFGRSAQEVAHFLNTQTPSDALIESYHPEVFFLLDRDYHYPPDEIHVPLMRQRELGEDVAIEYDPLAADPDYLVAGRLPGLATVYDRVLQTGAFRLLRVIEPYEIYERVR